LGLAATKFEFFYRVKNTQTVNLNEFQYIK
jgi:hypothetical protein